MRIGFNLIGYQPGCGGVETYILNLLKSVQQIDKENSYLIICDKPVAPFLLINAPNFQIKTVLYHKNSINGLMRGALLRLTGIDMLCSKLTNLNVDVMHYPLTILNPANLPYPSVLTFHDMQQEYFPDFFSPKELRQRRKTYQSSAQKAGAVITLSGHTKSCLVDSYGISPQKIHVVYSGCGTEFHLREKSSLEETRRTFDLRAPFIFYPAATWPHKNHVRLLQAIKILVDQNLFDGELILTGTPMNAHRDVQQTIKSLNLGTKVRWLGHLPLETIPYLYNLADIMAFPSLFEGFGLPVVEAMASGCPVVCSQSSSIPEVAGTAAAYFNPLMVEDIAETLSRVWNNKQLQETLRSRGLLQSAQFCWEKTAIETVEVYRHLTSPQ